MFIFSELPLELIQNIISYNGRLKYRSGKWMDQIDKKDPRYQLYNTIPPHYLTVNKENLFKITIYLPIPRGYLCNHWQHRKIILIHYDKEANILETIYKKMNLYKASTVSYIEQKYIRV